MMKWPLGPIKLSTRDGQGRTCDSRACQSCLPTPIPVDGNFQHVQTDCFARQRRLCQAFNNNGKPRWLTIQGVVWRDDGSVFTADLFENRAPIIGCSPACPFDGLIPRTAPTITKIGTVRVSFTGLGPYSDTPPQGIAEVFSLTGVSMFKSIILRIPL